MAKSLKSLPNGLSIKFLKRPNAYYLFFGKHQIMIDGISQRGFDSLEEAREFGEKLKWYAGINWVRE